MKTFRNTLLCVPAALWYWVIWRFSAQSAAVSGDLSDWLLWKLLALVSPAFSGADTDTRTAAVELLSFFERKAAHMFLYFVLILLIWLALLPLARGKLRQAGTAAGLCAVLAVLDEYHQTMVPGRSGEVRDVCVDLTGAAIALLLVALLLWTAHRREQGCRGAVSLLPAGLCAALTAGLAVVSIPFASLPAFAWAAERFVPDFSTLSSANQAALLAALSPIFRETCFPALCGLLSAFSILGAFLSIRRPLHALAASLGISLTLPTIPALIWGLPSFPAVILSALGWAVGIVLWLLYSLINRICKWYAV